MLAQTLPPNGIIVVDDGRRWDRRRCRGIAVIASVRIHTISQENQGASGSRNRAKDSASGDRSLPRCRRPMAARQDSASRWPRTGGYRAGGLGWRNTSLPVTRWLALATGKHSVPSPQFLPRYVVSAGDTRRSQPVQPRPAHRRGRGLALAPWSRASDCVAPPPGGLPPPARGKSHQ